MAWGLPDRDALVADAAGNDIIRVLPRRDVTTMARFDLVAMVGFHQHQRADGVGILCELLAQRPPGLDVQRQVDRLVRHPHLRIAREGRWQPPSDLLG